MNRLTQRQRLKWAAAALPPASSSASTSYHGVRFLTSTAPRRDEKDERKDADSAQSDSASPPSSTPSIFDHIFSGSDPFPKTESPRGRLLGETRDDERWSSPSMSSSSSSLPDRRNSAQSPRSAPLSRDVLFDDPRDPRARPPPAQGRNRTHQGRTWARRETDRSPLTSGEAAAFTSIFESIWSGDKRRSGLASSREREERESGRETSKSSSSQDSASKRNKPLATGGWLELHNYASRNLGARAALRDQQFAQRKPNSSSRSHADSTTPFNPRIAAVRAHNEVAAAGYSDAEIEEGIDRARTEMAECQTVGQLWDWAKREIWGGDTNEARVGETSGEQSTPATPRYGLSTPFYAPVLHTLFLTLRDRFHSPSSALQVLRLVRAVGPSSLVLGTTALLYTEAVRTRWIHLADLRGARDLLAEAREIGLLAGGAGANRGAREDEQQGAENWSASGEREEKSLRIVVDSVRSEVRGNVLGDVTARSGWKGEIGTELEGLGHVGRLEVPEDEASRQALAIVDEMGKLVGSVRRRSSYASAPSQRGQERFGGGMERRQTRRSGAFAA